MTEENKKWEDCGALWLSRKKDKNGKSFFIGKVFGKSVIVYKNEYKEDGDKKPYYKMYPLPDDGYQKEAPAQSMTIQQVAKVEFDDDDIGF